MNRLLKCFAVIAVVAVLEISAFGQAPPVAWAKKIAENYRTNLGVNWVSTAADNGGNTFFVGAFTTPTLAVEGQTLTNSSSNPGVADSFIIKYAPNGGMLWLRQTLGNGSEFVGAVGVDSAGNLIAAIRTSSAVVTIGTNSLTNNGGSLTALVKFDPQGNLLWIRSIAADSIFGAQSVNADPNGNILIAGIYYGTNISFGTNVSLTKTNASNFAHFLARFDSDGNALWARQVDLNADNTDPTAAVDNLGNSYLLEAFTGVANFGSVLLTNSASHTMSLAKYDPDGNLVWAREAGNSTSYIYPGPIWANADGSVCASGYYYGSAQLQTTNLPAAVGTYITFLSKYDSVGSLDWAKYIVGNSEVFPYSLGTDLIGNYYVVGRTQARSLTFDGITVTNTGSPTNIVTRAYAAKYASGGEVLWARLLTTDGVNVFGDGVVDSQGNVYFYGTAYGTNLLSMDGIVLQTPTNGTDYYFGVKISGPSLNIVPQGTDVVISWPTNAVGLNLESATNLAGAWSPVTNAPAVNGQSFVVTNAVAGSERYYRLRNF